MAFFSKNLAFTEGKNLHFLVERLWLSKLWFFRQWLNLFTEDASDTAFSTHSRQKIIDGIIHFLHVKCTIFMELLVSSELPLSNDVDVIVEAPLRNHCLTFYCMHYVDGATYLLGLSFREVLEEWYTQKKVNLFGFLRKFVNGDAVLILFQVQRCEVAVGSSHDPCRTQRSFPFSSLCQSQITEPLLRSEGMHLSQLPKFEVLMSFPSVFVWENLFVSVFKVPLHSLNVFNLKRFRQLVVALVFFAGDCIKIGSWSVGFMRVLPLGIFREMILRLWVYCM